MMTSQHPHLKATFSCLDCGDKFYITSEPQRKRGLCYSCMRFRDTGSRSTNMIHRAPKETQ